MLRYFLLTLVRRTPGIIVMLVAAGLAIVRFGRHPRVSVLTLVGVIVYFFRLLIFPLVFYYVPDMGRSLNLTGTQLNWSYTALNVLDDACLAFVAILFVVAAFSSRQQLPSHPTYQG